MNLSVEPGKRISRQAQRANTSHYSSKEVDEPSDGIVSGFEPSTEIFEEEAEMRHQHPPPPPKRVQQKARKVEKVEHNKQPVFSDQDLSGMILAEGTLQEKQRSLTKLSEGVKAQSLYNHTRVMTSIDRKTRTQTMDFRLKMMSPMTHPQGSVASRDIRSREMRISDKNWLMLEDRIIKRKSISKQQKKRSSKSPRNLPHRIEQESSSLMNTTTFFNTTSGRKKEQTEAKGLGPPPIPPPLHRHKRSQDWNSPNDALNLKSMSVNRRISEASTTLAPRTFQSERISALGREEKTKKGGKIDLKKLKEKCSAQSSKYTTPGPETKSEVTPFSLDQKYSKVETPVVQEESPDVAKRRLTFEQLKERENLRVITKFDKLETGEKSRNSETVLMEGSSKRSGGAVIEEIENEIKQEIEVEAQKIPDNILVEESDDSKYMPMLLETSKSDEERKEEEEQEEPPHRTEVADFGDQKKDERQEEEQVPVMEEIFPQDSVSEKERPESAHEQEKSEEREEKGASVEEIEEEKEEKRREIEMEPSVEVNLEPEKTEESCPQIEVLQKKKNSESEASLAVSSSAEAGSTAKEEVKAQRAEHNDSPPPEEEKEEPVEEHSQNEPQEVKNEEEQKSEKESTQKDENEEQYEEDEFHQESVQKEATQGEVIEVQAMQQAGSQERQNQEEKEEAGNTDPSSLNFPITSAEMIQKCRNQISDLELEDLKNTEEVYYYRRPTDREISQGDALAYRYEVLRTVSTSLRFTLYYCKDHKEKKEVIVRMQHSKWQKQWNQEEKIREIEELKPLLVQPTDSLFFRERALQVFQASVLQTAISHKRQKVQQNFESFAIALLRLISRFHDQNIVLASLRPELIIDTSQDQSSFFKLTLLGLQYHHSIFAGFEFVPESLNDLEMAKLAYLAPQVLLGTLTSQKVDLWIFGALLADLYLEEKIAGFQCFLPYFQKLLDFLGAPENIKEIVQGAKQGERLYSEEDQQLLLPFTKEGRLMKMLGERCEARIAELIEKCMSWESQKRPSVGEGLAVLRGQAGVAKSVVQELSGKEEERGLERRNGSV